MASGNSRLEDPLGKRGTRHRDNDYQLRTPETDSYQESA